MFLEQTTFSSKASLVKRQSNICDDIERLLYSLIKVICAFFFDALNKFHFLLCGFYFFESVSLLFSSCVHKFILDLYIRLHSIVDYYFHSLNI